MSLVRARLGVMASNEVEHRAGLISKALAPEGSCTASSSSWGVTQMRRNACQKGSRGSLKSRIQSCL